ncbi:DNA mismatch repair endonuclease MutL [Serpentinicella sp. ANB-PHB4]|uniref:DNA mismatch repair endonuclease MutL n=1 Tax=Serpentinicella sp. ANB-PHB4 TaxID=3074076 RepID=UPI0028571D13|nr:DNA mismatch repair endonuclease MutL [Serpentinicella sp. ANB-PHB4]MDR5658149.1 DNA mismatch repair endonuclease MutL [Serpentinicella sp. ANB-PHB4]
MIQYIQTLDDTVINKIAAGEVVEGPYSVVKELTENAIDAKADTIVVEIKEGGKKYIRVTDNGTGIKDEEIEKAFLRHTTSKINKINDLDTLLTLGFRGEALASIASVSQIELITKTQEQEHGMHIEIIGGKVVNKKEIGCPTGTTIIIRNLFFNTPARLKFMKSTQAETTKISEIISRLSLSKDSVSFKFINNNKVMFTTSRNSNLRDRILNIFGKEIGKNLIEINGVFDTFKVKGYIGQPNFVRGNRSYEITYVNGRFIKSKLIFSAIEDAYKGTVIINKFPICFLYIDIEPSQIDINVHPSKTEVKILNEQSVYNQLFNLIRNTLTSYTKFTELEIKNQNQNKSANTFDSHNLDYAAADHYKNDFVKSVPQENKSRESIVKENSTDYNLEIEKYFQKKLDRNDIEEEDTNQQDDFLSHLLVDYKIIGQIFNTYIMLEKENSIYLIDQHAAHERLLYNNLVEQLNNEKILSQQLIQPYVLEFSNDDCLILEKHIEKFRNLGFNIENFGDNTYVIRSVPLIMDQLRNFNFLYDIIDNIKSQNKFNSDLMFDDILIKKACKAAIKALDKLDIIEVENLINDILTLEPPLTCPHGRPIILTLTKQDIEKSFKRIQ